MVIQFVTFFCGVYMTLFQGLIWVTSKDPGFPKGHGLAWITWLLFCVKTWLLKSLVFFLPTWCFCSLKFIVTSISARFFWICFGGHWITRAIWTFLFGDGLPSQIKARCVATDSSNGQSSGAFFQSPFKTLFSGPDLPKKTEENQHHWPLKKKKVFDTLDSEWILITKKSAKPLEVPKRNPWSCRFRGEVALVASCFSSLFFFEHISYERSRSRNLPKKIDTV